MLIGATNHKLDLIRKYLSIMKLEDKLWEWCSSKGVTRCGYNRRNKLEENNSDRFLKHCEELKGVDWFPDALNPVLDCLKAFMAVKDATFSWDLRDGWEETITTYTSLFAELQEYSAHVLGLHLTATWKIHIICCHLGTFLSKVTFHIFIDSSYNNKFTLLKYFII